MRKAQEIDLPYRNLNAVLIQDGTIADNEDELLCRKATNDAARKFIVFECFS